MTLFVARHAHAGSRSGWADDDRLRPLSTLGESQARGIAERLVTERPERVLSSPALRCVQTVAPLAEKLGAAVEEDARLFEGAGRTEIAALIEELTGTRAVCCTHGDVVPLLLDHLLAAGMCPERDLVWQKASVWAVERTAAGWGVGRYLPPPRP